MKKTLEALAASMRHAFIERRPASIGGGQFTPEELKVGAVALNAYVATLDKPATEIGMNEDHIEMVDSLRDDGFMVIIFTPDELRNLSQVDKRYMENLVVLKGRDFLDHAAQCVGVTDDRR